ncbi:hypothetical protein BJF78_33565 [Pseudonocardia sp. CNS-139]|nr:hypothetical protein BJF78_33565 [Pseudonocardia sp. CNS-139]
MAEGGLHRFAVRLLESLGKKLWGFPPRLMPYLVAKLGPIGALSWFAANMPRYERTLRLLGPLRTHLACTVISLHNGCHYCSYGHAYAVELVYLKQATASSPVTAAEMCTWIGLPPAELRDRVCDVLERADLHAEVLWVDRTLAQARGQQRAVDRDEARIAHLVRMFGTLNAVGIAEKVEPDEAHDPLNKDHELKARNAALRGSPA